MSCLVGTRESLGLGHTYFTQEHLRKDIRVNSTMKAGLGARIPRFARKTMGINILQIRALTMKILNTRAHFVSIQRIGRLLHFPSERHQQTTKPLPPPKPYPLPGDGEETQNFVASPFLYCYSLNTPEASSPPKYLICPKALGNLPFAFCCLDTQYYCVSACHIRQLAVRIGAIDDPPVRMLTTVR